MENAPINQGVAPGTGIDREARRGPLSLLLPVAETGGRLAVLETTEGQGEGPPCHRHQWEEETLYVLTGDLAVWRAGIWIPAPAGTAVFLPRLAEHAFVVTTGPARLLVVVAPAGLEQLIAELGGQSLGSGGDAERLVTLAARYGVEITGPRPAPPPEPRASRPELTTGRATPAGSPPRRDASPGSNASGPDGPWSPAELR